MSPRNVDGNETSGGAAGSRAYAMRTGSGAAGRAGMVRAGALVRSLREDAGLSVRSLARRSAVAHTTVLRLERGQLRPRATLLQSIGWAIDPDRATELRAALIEAAGDGLAPDTAGTRRYRLRRNERGLLARQVPLPADMERRAGLHMRSAEARQAAYTLLEAPGALDDEPALRRAGQLLGEAHRLSDEAGAAIGIATSRGRVTYGFG